MAFALIANAIAGSTDTINVTTAGIDTTGATLIVIALAAFNMGTNPIDSKGNSWTALTERGSDNPNIRCWYCVPTSVGAGHTFSYSESGQYPRIAVQAWSGAAASPYDSESAGSITPAEDNEVLIAAIASSGSVTMTIDSGFTESDDVAGVAFQNYGLAMAYKVQTTAGSENPTWTPSGAATTNKTITAFKAAAAAAGHPAIKRYSGVEFAGRVHQGVRVW